MLTRTHLPYQDKSNIAAQIYYQLRNGGTDRVQYTLSDRVKSKIEEAIWRRTRWQIGGQVWSQVAEGIKWRP